MQWGVEVAHAVSTSSTSMGVACSTKIIGITSSRFLVEVWLFLSSSCFDLLLKNIPDQLHLVSSFDIN